MKRWAPLVLLLAACNLLDPADKPLPGPPIDGMWRLEGIWGSRACIDLWRMEYTNGYSFFLGKSYERPDSVGGNMILSGFVNNVSARADGTWRGSWEPETRTGRGFRLTVTDSPHWPEVEFTGTWDLRRHQWEGYEEYELLVLEFPNSPPNCETLMNFIRLAESP